MTTMKEPAVNDQRANVNNYKYFNVQERYKKMIKAEN